MENVLSIENLDLAIIQSDHQTPLLKGINLSLKKGQICALIGESGSGKSMTANAIMQLLPDNIYFSSRSIIELNNTDLLHYSEVKMRQVRGTRVSMVFQEPMSALNPVMTIGQQIAEVLITHKLATHLEAKKKVNHILSSVGLDEQDFYDYYPHQLSGGMRQRVVIAIAIAAEPDIVIADEPTTALDSIMQQQILELLVKLTKEKQVALLLITHDMTLVSKYTDEVALIYYGEIIEKNYANTFTRHPLHPYAKQLLEAAPSFEKREQYLSVIEGSVPKPGEFFQGCIFTPRCKYAMDICHKVKPKWYDREKGKVLCHLYQADTQESPLRMKNTKNNNVKEQSSMHIKKDEAILTVKNITKIFKKNFKGKKQTITAVDNVSFSINKGSCFALLGGSGSGKSTIAKLIAGLYPLAHGEIFFKQEVLNSIPRKEKANCLQLIFQDPYNSLNPKLTISENLKEALQFQKTTNKQKHAMLTNILEEVGLYPEVLSRFPHEFSGGQRQRIAIARAIAAKPQLLICDEPTSALDISVQAQILNLLKKLQQQYHITLLLITHNISVVAYMADAAAVMQNGHIVESGTSEQIMRSPKHNYTKALIRASNLS